MDLSPYRTAIVTAAASTNMTTRATVKAELEITDNASDARIDALIGQASATCISYLNRTIAQETVTDYFRRGRARGCSGVVNIVGSLWLSRWPVSSITGVTEDGAALDSVDWELNGDTGQLWRLDDDDRIHWSAAKIAVTYAGGYTMITDLPPDLERACISLVKLQWFAGRRDPMVKSETVPGVYEVAYGFGGITADNELPPEISGLLNAYRRISI